MSAASPEPATIAVEPAGGAIGGPGPVAGVPAGLASTGFRSPVVRRTILAAQVVLVGGVLGLWLGVDALRESRSLWMLFLYCFPSESLVATVPHEPVLLFFARFHPPLTVALVTAAGTVLTEAVNYSMIRFFADTSAFRRITDGRRARRVVGLFGRAPFVALVVAALTPVPFYPFRFLVVMARYPQALYLLAVAVGRTPRFYAIALLGGAVAIPNGWLAALFVTLVVAANAPALRRRLRGPSPP